MSEKKASTEEYIVPPPYIEPQAEVIPGRPHHSQVLECWKWDAKYGDEVTMQAAKNSLEAEELHKQHKDAK